MTEKSSKVVFAPGCFDEFEGTQEELDELQKHIIDMLSNLTPEELEQQSSPVDFQDLIDTGNDELADLLMKRLEGVARNLQ